MATKEFMKMVDDLLLHHQKVEHAKKLLQASYDRYYKRNQYCAPVSFAEWKEGVLLQFVINGIDADNAKGENI